MLEKKKKASLKRIGLSASCGAHLNSEVHHRTVELLEHTQTAVLLSQIHPSGKCFKFQPELIKRAPELLAVWEAETRTRG